VQLKRPSLSDAGRLDEYLFLNALTACSHYEALQSGTSTVDPGGQPEILATPLPNFGSDAGEADFPDYPALLISLAEIRRELDAFDPALNSPLQTLAERALAFLHASGVAIAISSGNEITCRASAGSAPSLGTPFQPGQGFSGKCIQSAVLMHCEDCQIDPRVDQEACASLGIRSIVAAPICAGSRCVGLIEVFAGAPNPFNQNSRIFLQRLANLIATTNADIAGELALTVPRGKLGDDAGAVPGLSVGNPEADELSVITTPESSHDLFSSRWQRILVLGISAAMLIAATLLMPWMRTSAVSAQPAEHSLLSKSPPAIPNAATARIPLSEVKRLHELAQAGDPYAQFALGARYATGEEVAQDYTIAAQWFALAADQGHVVAQATLGAYYWAGRGVPEDLHKAYFWSVLAQAGGDEGSKFRLESLASTMSHSEIVQIQEEAGDWIRQHQLSNRASSEPHF
jgi:hypothetical protein